MSDDKSEIVSWWTVDGWQWRPAPAEYQTYTQSETGDLEAAGYVACHRFGHPDETSIELTLYAVPFKVDHYLVDIWVNDGQLAAVFIEKPFLVPFVVDKLPALLRDFGIADHPSDLSRIRKAVVGFVRHGHGRTTISESGDRTREDMEFDQEQSRRERQRAAEQKRSAS